MDLILEDLGKEELGRVVQLEPQRKTPAASPLTPELREFIDNAIVPILVKQYLAEQAELAQEGGAVAKSVSSTAVRLRGQRP